MRLYSVVAALFVLAAPCLGLPVIHPWMHTGPVTVTAPVVYAGGRATFDAEAANAGHFHVVCTDAVGGSRIDETVHGASYASGKATVTLDGLVAGAKYACVVDAIGAWVQDEITSTSFEIVVPAPPGPIVVTERTIGQSSATFELSSAGSTGILAWCYGLGSQTRAVRTTVTPGATKETATLRVDGLVCGTTYSCFFKNENGAENPLHASVSFEPAPSAAPLPAPKLRSLKKTGTTASFATTTVPCAIGYKIDCHIVGKTRLLARKIVLGKDAVRVALENLRPGTGYVCAISAIGGARKPGRALTVRFSTNK